MPEDKYIITVTLRTAKAHKIQSPPLTKAEADRQLGVIRDSLGNQMKSPDIDWFAAKGVDIIGANMDKVPGIADII